MHAYHKTQTLPALFCQKFILMHISPVPILWEFEIVCENNVEIIVIPHATDKIENGNGEYVK